MMLTGIVVGVWLTLHLARKAGISQETTITAAIWGVLFGLVGARLSHVLDNLDFYIDNPVKILAIQEGGLGWYGGLIGGILAVVVYSRIKKFPLGRFADAAGFGVILGLSIGRIGCTINGDAAGTPTSLPWGLIYTHADSFAPLWIATHPAPVYEILWNLLILGVLGRLRRRLQPDGSLFLLSLAAYSFGRFFISWVRAESAVLGPLHQSHVISLALFVIAIGWLIYTKVHWVKTEPREEERGSITS